MPKHENGVWNIEYPTTLRAAVENTADNWELFCSLPDDAQNVFTANTMFNGIGFERKIGTGTRDSRYSHDKKLNFDITSAGTDELEDHLNGIRDRRARRIAQDFVHAAKTLTHHASTAIEEFGDIIETSHAVHGFRELAARSAPNAFFRALYYPPTETGDIIGDPHVDNSGFTLHLFESTSGCEALSTDSKTWYPMPVADGNALAFPSMQTQLYSQGEVDGLCHRITANETTRRIGRSAIVCFVPLLGVAPYDRHRHGRLQEKMPGFNYGMNPVEFADFFKYDERQRPGN